MAEVKQVEIRSSQANWQRRKHAEGLCPRCGQEKLDFNKRSGKPYSKCFQCRQKWNLLQAEIMKKRRREV